MVERMSGIVARAAIAAAGALLSATVSVAVAGAPLPYALFAQQLPYERVALSPDGEYVATDALVGSKRVLRLMRLSDRHTVDVTPPGRDDVVSFDWVNKRRLLYTVGTRDVGTERPVPTGELYFVNADGSSDALLFGARGRSGGRSIEMLRAPRVSAVLVDALRGDDRNILVWIARTRPEKGGSDEIVARLDVVDGARQQLFASPLRFPAGFLADSSGNVRFAYGSNSDNIYKVLYRAGDDDAWDVVFDGNVSAGRAQPLQFSADDRIVYWSCEPEHRVGGVCRWSPETRRLEPVWSSREVESDRLLLDFDRKTLAAVQSERQRPELAVIDRDADVVKALRDLSRQFPGQFVEIASVSDDGTRVVVYVRSDTNPGEWHLLERASGKLEFLFRRAEGLDATRLATMEPLHLNTRDGITVHGYLTSPPGQENAKRLPAVVLVHGGPYFMRDRWQYDPNVQALASRGYAVLQINFRGSEGYGAAFEVAGYGEWGAKMQDDLTDATRWLIERGIADPRRICIAGTSYGAYAALMAAVREPDLYRCAIGNSGVYDLRELYRRGPLRDSDFGRNFLRRVLGNDKVDLARRSPATQLDRIKAKLMLIAGGKDDVVPPANSEELHAALEQRKVAHEWYYVPGEGHGFYAPANRAELYRRMVEFLDAATTVEP